MENTDIQSPAATFNDAANAVNHLGQFEYRLAISKLGANASLQDVIAAIEEHRAPFMREVGGNIGSSVMLSSSAWQKLANESDDAAKKILLSDSKAMRNVEDMISKAEVAAEVARKAQAEFDRLYAELDAIPAQKDALNLKLAQISNTRHDLAHAEEIVKDLYAAALRGAIIERGALEMWSGLVATKQLRLDVLAEIESEVKAELVKVEAREKELRRQLR
jgi:hypothetical protein